MAAILPDQAKPALFMGSGPIACQGVDARPAKLLALEDAGTVAAFCPGDTEVEVAAVPVLVSLELVEGDDPVDGAIAGY